MVNIESCIISRCLAIIWIMDFVLNKIIIKSTLKPYWDTYMEVIERQPTSSPFNYIIEYAFYQLNNRLRQYIVITCTLIQLLFHEEETHLQQIRAKRIYYGKSFTYFTYNTHTVSRQTNINQIVVVAFSLTIKQNIVLSSFRNSLIQIGITDFEVVCID